MNLSIRFLIGLSAASDNDTHPPTMPVSAPDNGIHSERARRALSLLSKAYDGFTSWRGTGAWKGATEPCLVVERIADVGDMTRVLCATERVKAREIARTVARALGQESVMVVFQPVEVESVGP